MKRMGNEEKGGARGVLSGRRWWTGGVVVDGRTGKAEGEVAEVEVVERGSGG
jgi:hypothetical protein